MNKKLKKVVKEFKYMGIYNKKLKLQVIDDTLAIYEVKDKDGVLNIIKIISNVPMFRNCKIKHLLYKTPLYLSHSFDGEEVFSFNIKDCSNEKILINFK